MTEDTAVAQRKSRWRTNMLIGLSAWVFLLSVIGVGLALRLQFDHNAQKREQQAVVNRVQTRQLQAQRRVLAELCRTNAILAALVEATAQRMKVDNPDARQLRTIYYGYLVELTHRSACKEVVRP